MHFLDTNICIYFLKGMYPQVRTKIMAASPEDIKIPTVVKAELLYGAAKSVKRQENKEKVERFLAPFEIVPFDDAATQCYAGIRFQTEASGTPMGPNDLMIAAIVLAQNGILVTNNTREFSRVPALEIEDWTREE